MGTAMSVNVFGTHFRLFIDTFPICYQFKYKKFKSNKSNIDTKQEIVAGNWRSIVRIILESYLPFEECRYNKATCT